MTTNETWRGVVGYEDRYEVSDLGRFRTLGRQVPGRWPGQAYFRAGRLLAGHDNGRYLVVSVAGKSRLAHRLVLDAFVGARPDLECRHLNGNPRDNRLVNLAWGTPTENQFDRFRHGTACEGETNYRAELSEADVRRVMKLRGRLGPAAIARELGHPVGRIKHVLYGQAWNWLTGLPRLRHREKTTRPPATPAVERWTDPS